MHFVGFKHIKVLKVQLISEIARRTVRVVRRRGPGGLPVGGSERVTIGCIETTKSIINISYE